MQSYIILRRFSPGQLPLLPLLASLSSQHSYSCLAGHPLAQMDPVWKLSWTQASKGQEVLDHFLFWADMQQRLGKPDSSPRYRNHPVLFPQSWVLKPQTTLAKRWEAAMLLCYYAILKSGLIWNNWYCMAHSGTSIHFCSLWLLRREDSSLWQAAGKAAGTSPADWGDIAATPQGQLSFFPGYCSLIDYRENRDASA